VGDEVDVVIKQLEEFLQKNSTAMVSNSNRDFVTAMFSWEQNVNRLVSLIQE
jgi:hypothetical protein